MGLWSRLEGLEREDLTRALGRRTVIQATLMRATIHMVSARDYWPLVEAIRRDRRDWYLRVARRRVAARAMEVAARRTRSLLAAGPRKRAELVELLGVDATTWNGVGVLIDLVRVPPSGTWGQPRADIYGLAQEWLGPSTATESDGVELLVRRYLGAFGPASRRDVASWSGLSLPVLAPTIERLGLRRFRDERGEELIDLRRAPLPDLETPAPVRLLPTWDATLLVHARRTQILPERYRSRVFNTKTPQSVSTFLVDGQVAGTWRRVGGRVKLEPFERLAREARRELEDEAERLEAFIG